VTCFDFPGVLFIGGEITEGNNFNFTEALSLIQEPICAEIETDLQK
jgi:hypothetical protein